MSLFTVPGMSLLSALCVDVGGLGVVVDVDVVVVVVDVVLVVVVVFEVVDEYLFVVEGVSVEVVVTGFVGF